MITKGAKALLGCRCKCASIENTAALRIGANFRAFRTPGSPEVPDAEARSEDGSSSVASGGASGTTGRPQGPGGDQRTAPAECSTSQRLGPTRTTQSVSRERRRVLAPVYDEFTGNVATLLVRWPHAPLQRAPRSWREVLENERFQYLFPRRLQPFTRQAIQAFESLAAADDAESGLGGSSRSSGSGRGVAPGPPLSDAQQAALTELVDRLQAMQRHLQDSDDGTDGNTVITVAAFATDDLDNDEDDSDDESLSSSGLGDAEERSHAHAGAAPLTLQHSSSSSGSRGGRGGGAAGEQEAEETDAGAARAPLGRRLRSPCARRQRGTRPAPPWDDTQPFQTHVGTVYHFWRLCPYG